MTKELKALEKKSYIQRLIVSWITILSIAVCLFAFIPKPVLAEEKKDSTSSATESTSEATSEEKKEDTSSEKKKDSTSSDDKDDKTKKKKATGDTAIKDEMNGEVMHDLDVMLDMDNIAECYAVMCGELTDGSFISNTINTFYDSTVMDTVVNTITGKKKSWVTGLTTALKGIAALMIICNMIITLLKEVERGDVTMESWLRILITFSLPCVILAEYDGVITGLSKIGRWLYQSLNNNITLSNTSAAHSFTGIPFPTFSSSGIFWLSDAINYLHAYQRGVYVFMAYLFVNFIVVIMILSGVLSNYVEIVLRHVFMPLAIANISHEGVRSAGVRYIKRYLGCYMKVAAIMVAVSAVFYIYNLLLKIKDIHDVEKILFFMLLIPVIKQSLKMCNEIIGDAMGD